MLLLTRRVGESIIIGEDIKIEVDSLAGPRAVLNINGPKDIKINERGPTSNYACNKDKQKPIVR